MKMTRSYLFSSILALMPLTGCGINRLNDEMLAMAREGKLDDNAIRAMYAQGRGGISSENGTETTPGSDPTTDADSEIDENTVTTIEFLDPQYEWSQLDNKKKGKAIIRTEGLILESKEEEGVVSSVVELPVSADTFAFDFGATFTNAKLEEDKAIGLIFNYRNERNYQAISVFKKGFQVEECVDGTISVIKRGLAKTDKRRNTLQISYQGGKMSALLNGIELTTVKNMAITSSMFGVFVTGKNVALLNNFMFSIPDENTDSEQSTTDM